MLKAIIELQHYQEIENVGSLKHGREARIEIVAETPKELGELAEKIAQQFEELK